MALFFQPSSFAGYGLIYTAVSALAANWKSIDGWALLFTGIAAVLKPEGATAPRAE
jgi:hypothetical protein